MGTKRLIDCYDKKNNSYDDIRFLLATIVLYVHSYALLYGEGKQEPFVKLANFQLGLGSLAVYGFFVLSGFFMIQSLESNDSLLRYFKNRALRILPAFWLSLLISSFVLAPILAENFDIKSAINFFFKAGFFHIFGYAWTINGVFPHNPMIDGINGSMWTLKHEIALYILLPFIVYLTHKKRILLFFVFAVFFILAFTNINSNFILFNIPCCRAWVLAANEYPSFIVFSAYFFAGVILYKYREFIIASKRIWFMCFALFIIALFFGNLKIITLFVFAYLIILFGSNYKKKIFSRTGDYSYGMYIYAFPVQQTLVHFYRESMNVYIFLIVSFFITLMLSILSWHFLEKKFLKFKKR